MNIAAHGHQVLLIVAGGCQERFICFLRFRKCLRARVSFLALLFGCLGNPDLRTTSLKTMWNQNEENRQAAGNPWSAHNNDSTKSVAFSPQPFQTPEQRVWVTMWDQNEEEETGRREVMNKWDKMLKYVSAALSCGHCYSHKSLPFNFNWAFLCHCLFVDQVMRPSKASKYLWPLFSG